MTYGEFDPKKYPEEAALKLKTLESLCALANKNKCAVSMDGMSVQPERALETSTHPSPGEEMTATLRFLGRLRKAVGAFFDNLPQD